MVFVIGRMLVSDKINDWALHSDDGFGICGNKEMCY